MVNKVTSVEFFERFKESADKIEVKRRHFESLFSSASIQEEDLSYIYVGLYLSLFTLFEEFLEELFFGLLKNEIVHVNKAVLVKVKIDPIEEIEELLLIGRSADYLDWLPYGKTLDRSNLFFQNGYPFSFFDDGNKSVLSRLLAIRNAIAHKSEAAREKFERLINAGSLTIRERTPVGYLRSCPRSGGSQTQFQIAVVELKRMTQKLCQ